MCKFTFPISEPEFEIARRVERSNGGAQTLQNKFCDEDIHPFKKRIKLSNKFFLKNILV